VANPVADVALEDRTARARIRDAALVLFAERGTKGATVRDIAKAAGVSGGLLRHHFGPKDGLRDACDSYVLAKLMRMKERAVLEGELANPAFMSAAQPEMLLLYRYLARSMIDGSPQAASMFDEMVALGEKWLERNDPGRMVDPRAYAAVLVAMELTTSSPGRSEPTSSAPRATCVWPRPRWTSIQSPCSARNWPPKPTRRSSSFRCGHLSLPELRQGAK